MAWIIASAIIFAGAFVFGACVAGGSSDEASDELWDQIANGDSPVIPGGFIRQHGTPDNSEASSL